MAPKDMETKLQEEIDELQEIQEDLLEQAQDYVRRTLGFEED